jgi:thiamine biosynthesis lipoprotein
MMQPVFQPSRRSALTMLGAALLAPRVGLAAPVEIMSGAAFGTYWQISAPDGGGASELAADIQQLFDGIDRVFSPWRADSTISRFNRGRAGATDPAFIEVTTAALDIARKSEGAFDPTVGPLVAQWGFGPVLQGSAPDWRALSVGPDLLTKARADLTLDLCGIAKGWALDRAAGLARDAGFDNLLIDLGGELYAQGRHPAGRDWHVAIEAPLPMQSAPAVLRLPTGAAVATSGTRAQSYQLNGRTYSHIIDPLTRAPAAGGLRSVTVVAPDAMTADGWATALCAAGASAGPDLATTQDIAALFLIEQDGALRAVRTGQISQFIL